MTAFARTQENHDFGQISWEIRSVNQRYLEISPRLPDNFRHLETALRTQIKQHIARGKLDISLQVNFAQTQPSMQVNAALLDSLNKAIDQVQNSIPAASHINPLEVLQWPGVLQVNDSNIEQETLDTQVLNGLQKAIDLFSEHRLREGQGLAEVILQRCESISQLIAHLEAKLPGILENHTQNLKNRITSLVENLNNPIGDEINEHRFHQEVAIIAQKMDINEEIERIKIHLNEVIHIISQNGKTEPLSPIGRRLDFLMQELNREANTLGSKSISAFTSQTSVDLKVLIEQMREQVQNIE